MRKHLFLLTFLCCSISCQAQDWFGTTHQVRDIQKGIKVGIGGTTTKFFNSNLLNNGKLFETGLGYQIEAHWQLLPIAAEINFSKSNCTK